MICIMPKRTTQALPVHTVTKVKQLLSTGVSQTKVAKECGISQPMVSYIYHGQRYAEVPWPNGNTGSYEDAHGRPIGRTSAWTWSEEASAYMQWPEFAQQKMLDRVNEEREQTGRHPLPSIAVEWELVMSNPPIEDPEQDDARRMKAFKAEDQRRASVFREFSAIVNQSISEKRNREIDEMFAEALDPPPQSRYPSPAINPAQSDRLNWDYVLSACAENHPALIKIRRTKDKIMAAAVCMIFASIPERQWSEPYALKAILEVYDQLTAAPEAVAAIETWEGFDELHVGAGDSGGRVEEADTSAAGVDSPTSE